MSFQDYKSVMDNAEPHLLLDVRPLVEVEICHLPFSLSILSVMEMQNAFCLGVINRFLSVHVCPFISFLHTLFFFCYSPDIAARHSSLKFRGKEERTSPITSEENQPVETADGR